MVFPELHGWDMTAKEAVALQELFWRNAFVLIVDCQNAFGMWPAWMFPTCVAG